MIEEFVASWELNKASLRQEFLREKPSSYAAIVRLTASTINSGLTKYSQLDIERLVEVAQGSYQGTQLFIFPETGYLPATYWCVKIHYGSCSGCDTLEALQMLYDKNDPEKGVDELMMLALHIVQELKEL